MHNIQARCQCDFSRDRITNETYHCTSQRVIYSATIHGTATSTSSQIISYIERWIAEETVAVTLHQAHLRVGGSCTMVTEPLTSMGPESQATIANDPQKDQNRIFSFGIVSSGLVVFILASAVIILVILLVRKKHHAQTHSIDHDVYDRINRYPLPTGRSLHKQNLLNVPAYENIQLQNTNERDSEKIELSICPAYEDTITQKKPAIEETGR